MSRTYKDRPYRVKYPDDYFRVTKDRFYERVAYHAQGTSYFYNVPYDEIRYYSVKRPYVLKKKPKRKDTDWRWMSTPGWFIREFMTRPQRKMSKTWEGAIVKEPVWAIYEDLVDEAPIIGRKPHVYYR